MIGTAYLAVIPDAEVKTATLAMPGGGIAQLLRDSPTFGPRILQGLAAQGLTQGTTLLEQFFRDAQSAVDAGDPVNYIAAAAVRRPIHLIQVVGDGVSVTTQDQVIPNTATQRLIDAAGLTKITAAGANVNPAGHRAYVNFTAGNHGSIIDPTASLAATTEMQTQTAVFTGLPPSPAPGTVVLISNPAVVQNP
jgi:hypothetical protein